MKRAWSYLASILSGAILVFAFPNWNVEIAVWLWMLPLLAVLWPRRSSLDTPHSSLPKHRPFLLGWLSGVAFFIPNLWWLRHSSRVLPPAYATDHSWAGWGPELMGFSAVVGLSIYCALYFGLWSWFAAKIARPRDDSSYEILRSALL